jgi:hypothetical protein
MEWMGAIHCQDLCHDMMPVGPSCCISCDNCACVRWTFELIMHYALYLAQGIRKTFEHASALPVGKCIRTT